VSILLNCAMLPPISGSAKTETFLSKAAVTDSDLWTILPGKLAESSQVQVVELGIKVLCNMDGKIIAGYESYDGFQIQFGEEDEYLHRRNTRHISN
jgi:hypothetical protein